MCRRPPGSCRTTGGPQPRSSRCGCRPRRASSRAPSRRALATAEPIARANGVEVVVDERLREVERWPNLPSYEEHVAAVARYLAGEPVDGWEPREQADRRFREAVAGLDDAVVVTHGTVLALFLGLDLASWRAMRLPEVYEWTR
jgi:broad specificity phosphatase PhoE